MAHTLAPLRVLATNSMFKDETLAALSKRDLDEYREKRDFDALASKLPADKRPTVFSVKRLPPVAAATLDTMGAAFRWMTAFKWACHLIEMPDGSTLQPDPKSMHDAHAGVQSADEDWFNEIATQFGIETCYEVGRVAHEMARLPASAKGPFTWPGG